jgi:hypothetical protein
MDFGWLIQLLIFLVIIGAAFAIIKYFIMPAIPAPLQVFVWAVIGILLLIALIYFFGSGHNYFGNSHGRVLP